MSTVKKERGTITAAFLNDFNRLSHIKILSSELGVIMGIKPLGGIEITFYVMFSESNNL